MFRTLNTQKVRQLKANSRTAMPTILFLVLLGAAMFFIAFAGHI